MKSKQTQIGLFQRIIMIFFVFVMTLKVCTPPVLVVEAADAYTYYIQTAIDTSNWTIAAGVVNDKDGLFGNYTEIKRIGTTHLENLKTTSPSEMHTELMASLPTSSSTGLSKDNKVLSFPGFDTSGIFFTPQASTAMQDRAMFIKDSIVFDLNTAINVVYEGKSWTSLDDFREDVVVLLSAAENGGNVNGWSFTRTFSTDETLIKKLTNEDQGVYPANYVEISKGSNKYYLMTGIIKYLDTMSESDKPSDPSKDTQYITWGMVFFEALVNSTLEKDAVTVDTVYNSTVQGLLEGAVTDLFSALLMGLRSLLGLWDLDQLIFNRGSRGSTGFVAGIFPSSWESFIWTFFLVMEILSFAVIMMAIAKHIMQRAAATVNPAIRANLMEQIKDMAIGVIFLILLPALLVGLMQLSAALVEVFDKIVEDKSITETLSHYSTGNSIAAIVVGFANLIINIYFNWFYIIREVTIALLIVTSPIFVAWICMGSSRKDMAMRWLMELLSNIFIQPIHALLFAFIVLLPNTGRPIESLVMLYCLIPLTALLKGLFFPGVSDIGHRMAGAAGAKANAMAKKAGMAALATGVASAQGAMQVARAMSKDGGSGESSGGLGSAADNNIRQKNVGETISASNSKPEKDKTKEMLSEGAGEVGDSSKAKTPSDGKHSSTDLNTTQNKSLNNKVDDGGVVDVPKEKAFGTDPENNATGGALALQKTDLETNQGNDEKVPVTAKMRSTLGEFRDTFKQNLREAGAMTPSSRNIPQAISSTDSNGSSQERFAMIGAATRIVAGAAATGAIRGWRGQVFADHTNNTTTRNAMTDFAAASKSMAEKAQQRAAEQELSDVRQDKAENRIPSIPHQQVGDDLMTKKDEATANGFENLERFKVNGEEQMSYDVNAEDLSRSDRESLSQIADNPEMKAAAETAGYKVSRIRNSDGTETGRFHVSVGKNQFTGAKAPEFQGSNIVHGGKNYNSLIPDAGAIRNMANEAKFREEAQQAEEAKRMADIREGKNNNTIPSIPTTQVGDYCITKMDEAQENGLENLQRAGRGLLSYDVDAANLSAKDRSSLSEIADNPDVQQMVGVEGYTVDRIKNSDGTDSDRFHVTVGGNGITGAQAPEIQGGNIVHGGSRYNSLIPDVESIRHTSNEAKLREEAQQAEEAKRMADIREGKNNNTIPSIPTTQVGDYCITKMDEAQENGLENLQRAGRSLLSYDVDAANLSAKDRSSLSEIADNYDARQIAEAGGYTVDRVKNPDGSDSDRFHVTVGGNSMTGGRAPEIQGGNIVHGGSRYNSLIPDVESIQSLTSDLHAYEEYRQVVNQNESQMRELEESLESSRRAEVDTIKNRERIGLSSIESANRAQDTRNASDSVAVAAGIGGIRSVAGSGDRGFGSFSYEQAENQGIHNLTVDSNTGGVSYQFLPEEVSNGYLQVLSERLNSSDKDSVIAEYKDQGYTITETPMQNSAGEVKTGYTVQVAPREKSSPVLKERSNTGGTLSFTASAKSTPIVPVVSGGESASAIVQRRSEEAMSSVATRVNDQIQSYRANMSMPEMTESVQRGKEIYDRMAATSRNGRDSIGGTQRRDRDKSFLDNDGSHQKRKNK